MNGGAGLPQRFADSLGQLLGPDFPADLGLAVSGGGDSMAMLHLAAGWARIYGIRLWPVTVDHGLRAESAAEATLVAAEAKALGLQHSILKWEGWDRAGNLQDAARRARLDLIDRWRGGVRHVLFAHTQDDQAETFLLRLRRGSGVEGLAAMRPVREVRPRAGPVRILKVEGAPPDPPVRAGTWFVVRPLIEVTRAELRHYLKVLKIPHVDDPTNDDPTYDRVRMRRLLDTLDAEGIGRDTLAGTARRLARAADALARRAYAVAAEVARVDHGDVVLDRDRFAAVEADTQLRLLAAALQFVASAEYRPRAAALEDALDRVLGGGASTLHGCRIVPGGAELRVFRELAAVADLRSPADGVTPWDNRWLCHVPAPAGGEVRALGPDGLAQAGAAATGAGPRDALAVAPAIFAGSTLVACRRIGFGPAYSEELRPPGGGFPDRLVRPFAAIFAPH